MLRYIARRLLWGVALLFITSAVDLRDLLRPAVGRSGRAAGRAAGEPGADRADPRDPRPRRADLRAVLGSTSRTWSCTSTSATATSRRAGPRADLRPAAGDDLPRPRRGRSSGCVGIPVGIISAIRPRSLLDRSMMVTTLALSRRRSSGSGWSRSTCSPTTSASSRSSPGSAATADADWVASKAGACSCPGSCSPPHSRRSTPATCAPA